MVIVNSIEFYGGTIFQLANVMISKLPDECGNMKICQYADDCCEGAKAERGTKGCGNVKIWQYANLDHRQDNVKRAKSLVSLLPPLCAFVVKFLCVPLRLRAFVADQMRTYKTE